MGTLRPMQIETLDHVALWVADRDRLADFLVGSAGMHVIDRTDRFTLVGSDARRGKLTLDVKVNVADDKVDSANVITLNQFTFGGAVQSPEATKLPVRLGVALLKDTEGKIVLDVPAEDVAGAGDCGACGHQPSHL